MVIAFRYQYTIMINDNRIESLEADQSRRPCLWEAIDARYRKPLPSQAAVLAPTFFVRGWRVTVRSPTTSLGRR
jgi:hypothetical protein